MYKRTGYILAILSAICFLFSPEEALAQTDVIVVWGYVYDSSTNSPVEGVRVVVEGDDVVSLTNQIGRYRIVISGQAAAKITFSKEGYNSVTTLLRLLGGPIRHDVRLERPATSPGIVRLKIDHVGDIPPDRCRSESSPCDSLFYGSKLSLEISRRGYAVAYLQDEGNFFYNQEGRFVIKNDTTGDIKLWPGNPENIAHSIFRLYIVTSNDSIPLRSAGQGLSRLPRPATRGPIYLRAWRRREQ